MSVILENAVDTIEDLRLITGNGKADMYVKGHAAIGDDGGGHFVWINSGITSTYTDNDGTIIVPIGGDGSAAWLRNYAGDINIKWFGAHLDGSTSDTDAWNAALATGECIFLPEGTSVITDKLIFSSNVGQKITGAGRRNSTFKIDSSVFNMAATSVMELSGRGQGVFNCGFLFTQLSTTERASLNAYPWAIDLAGNERCEIGSVLISYGYNGIRLQGNCGGAVIDDVQNGCFNKGLLIDGALDSVRINRYHSWPFGISDISSLYDIYCDGQTIAAEFGRCDDLNIGSFLSFCGRVRFVNNGSGATFGVGSSITLDSNYGRLEFEAGEMTLSSLYSSTAATNDYLIRQTGGELKIAALAIECGVDLSTYAMVELTGSTSRLVVSTVLCTIAGSVTTAFKQTDGVMVIGQGYFNVTPNVERTQPIIDVNGGRAVLMGLQCSDAGTGTGNFIDIATDENHIVTGNGFTGWGYSLPATKILGMYGPNLGAASSISGGDYIGVVRIKKFTGTLDGSGNVTFAHGIAGGNTKIIDMSGYYIGASSERVPLTINYIDGSNVSVSGGGGAANRNYECWLRHS